MSETKKGSLLQKQEDKRTFLLRELAMYAVCILLVSALLVLLYDLTNADFDVPAVWQGDVSTVLYRLKALHDDGFWGAYVSSYTGAPGGVDLRDYPSADLLTTAIQLLAAKMFTPAGRAFNAFFLLSFYIAALPALYVFRQLKFDRALSTVLALLYAYPFFHMCRVNHTMFLLYGFLAFALLICVRMMNEPEKLFYSNGRFNGAKPIIFTVLMCFAISMTGNFYYPFFAGCIFLLAGVYLCFNAPKERRNDIAINAGLSIAAVITGLVVNYIPYFVFYAQNGRMAQSMTRAAADGELYGLKVVQMLLPSPYHRLPLFQRVTQGYASGAPLVNENETAALGILCALFFLFLLLLLLVNPAKGRFLGEKTFAKLKMLSSVNIFLVLYATVGGFSSILYLVFPLMRGHNRISVCVSFLCLMALGYLVTAAMEKFGARKAVRVAYIPVLILVLAFGLWDQTFKTALNTPAQRDAYYSEKSEYEQIYSLFDAGDNICQLPYRPYPENPPYEYLNAYVFDEENKLNWSGGAVYGRGTGVFLEDTEQLPPAECIGAVREHGYDGIVLYRDFDADYTAQLEPALAAALGAPDYATDRFLVYRLD